MKRIIIFSLIGVFGLFFGFAAYVTTYPRIVMDRTLTRIAMDGEFLNTWRMGRRPGPDSRGVVRPSPDLAYAICVYDLSNGPLKISVAPWDDYWSLSLYAANTDNYWTVNDKIFPDGVEIVLQSGKGDATSSSIVKSPTLRGAALIRRLAPTKELYEKAAALNNDDKCETVGMPISLHQAHPITVEHSGWSQLRFWKKEQPA